MKKTKSWKLGGRGCKIGKFDRNFLKNYEGTHTSMHFLRNREHRRHSSLWVPDKYINGLLAKYTNKPIELLEEAYNSRIKDTPNADSFIDTFKYYIYGINYEIKGYCGESRYKYRVEDGILIKNPLYTEIKFPKKDFLLKIGLNIM